MIRRCDDMLRELGLTPCHGILPTGHYCGLNSQQHAKGVFSGKIVHCTDDEVDSWPDIKAFTRFAARALDPSLNYTDQPFWRQLYRENMAAREVGRRLNIRVPRRYLVMERLTVLTGVAGLPNSIPLRKQAYDWARR